MTAKERWIGFRKNNGKVHCCPESKVFDIVGIREAIEVLAIGFEPYKMGNFMNSIGFTPEMHEIHKFILNRRPGRPSRPIICDQTGVQYPSVNAAARDLGISQGNLANHLRHPQAFKSVRGLTFQYKSMGIF